MSNRNDEITSAMPADLDSLPRLHGFRLRGMQMTRLETFMDAAFAFAISMLVIAAQQIPDNGVILAWCGTAYGGRSCCGKQC